MAKKKPVDPELQALGSRLLEVLEAQRIQGGDAYPSTLGRLAELIGITPDRAIEVVANKDVTSKIAVTKKTDRKTTAESLVHFKAHPPAKAPKRPPTPRAPKAPKADPADLAGRMLAVLETQRRLGPEAYPTTVRRLVELCDHKASGPLVTKAVAHEAVTSKAAVVGSKKPVLDNLILLRTDLEAMTPPSVAGLLTFALEAEAEAALKPAPKAKKPPGVTHAFPASALAKRLGKAWEAPFGASLREGIEGEALPREIAWLLIKGEPHFFKLEHVHGTDGARTDPATPAAPSSDVPPPLAAATARDDEPAAPQPPSDFAVAFRAAFDRLNRHFGSTNFIKLTDLRHDLPEFGREAFDAGLRQLRLDGEFALDSHEGLTGPLAPEDRAAAVVEAGSILVYASRR